MLPPARPEEVTDLPAGIALLHQFANSEDLRSFVVHGRRLVAHDALATPGDLGRWLGEHDLLPSGQAVTATADGSWRRLRMCPAPDCQWVFYDRSRPGRARWCSPRLCGNRMKTQAYRRRGPAETP